MASLHLGGDARILAMLLSYSSGSEDPFRLSSSMMSASQISSEIFLMYIRANANMEGRSVQMTVGIGRYKTYWSAALDDIFSTSADSSWRFPVIRMWRLSFCFN